MRISDWSSDVCSSDLDAIDALEQAFRIDPQQLVVRGRDDAAVIGEGAVAQLRGQHRIAEPETDFRRRQTDLDIALGFVEQLAHIAVAFAQHADRRHSGPALRAHYRSVYESMAVGR